MIWLVVASVALLLWGFSATFGRGFCLSVVCPILQDGCCFWPPPNVAVAADLVFAGFSGLLLLLLSFVLRFFFVFSVTTHHGWRPLVIYNDLPGLIAVSFR